MFEPIPNCQRERLSVLFDFSASPTGGALRRLQAFIDYSANSSIDATFLVHPIAAEQLPRTERIVPVYRPKAVRLLKDYAYLKPWKERFDWYYAYGTPPYIRIAKRNWFHISNILPFLPNNSKNYILSCKMKLLGKRFVDNARNIDVLSAESQFSLDIGKKALKTDCHTVVSPNGMSRDIAHTFDTAQGESYGRYAIAIGTHHYKRIDKTISIFEKIKEEYLINKLFIAGEVVSNKTTRNGKDVIFLGGIDHSSLMKMLSNATLFISTSEIENSPNSLLEAMWYCPRVIVSDIPPHVELIDGLGAIRVFRSEFSAWEVQTDTIPDRNSFPTWQETISDSLNRMFEMSRKA